MIHRFSGWQLFRKTMEIRGGFPVAWSMNYVIPQHPNRKYPAKWSSTPPHYVMSACERLQRLLGQVPTSILYIFPDLSLYLGFHWDFPQETILPDFQENFLAWKLERCADIVLNIVFSINANFLVRPTQACITIRLNLFLDVERWMYVLLTADMQGKPPAIDPWNKKTTLGRLGVKLCFVEMKNFVISPCRVVYQWGRTDVNGDKGGANP